MTPPPSSGNPGHFGDRLNQAIANAGTPLCMGIDPHPGMIPSLFGDSSSPGSSAAIRAIEDFGMACIDEAARSVPAIKPQAAFFEAHGPDGMRVLAGLSKAAREAGLLVVMDAKRGDIGSTSAAYAAAWLGDDAPFASDALTINAYLGLDTLEPFLARADSRGAGLFVLVRTSNQGAGDLQDLKSGHSSVFQHLASKLAPLAGARTGASGWSSLGVVVGATWPEEAANLREILPHSPFLVPGFGAQGAGADQALAGLVRENAEWRGGLVNSTRALIFPPESRGVASIDAWRKSVRDAVRGARSALAAT